ncbi:Vi polysaccharide biosynthesis UDP-N-acetylglucosamine C-6 dehydrogenase TviB [Cupriavidus sp. 2MCAB6]|uniref:Vi polysaccharide biosynthesis UDP-N-acetylglucosamine C-6 dehydrogenase TviB n=1 Tax=Cupriavidus sp. 2MCAB6 TaxID=3232981 RepID=UPI003F9148E9
MILSTHKIAVIGLGYVGLPLAVEFGKKTPVIGYDISTSRIAELNSGQDRTMEVDGEELHEADKLSFTGNPDDLRECTVFIVTVPTPVDDTKRPDLTPLIKASEAVGRIMPSGAIVIYESTVYPGATEEVCVPVLEKFSGKKFNVDFYCGYSPERINPGDKERRLPGIKKVTSGSTPEIAEVVDQLYRQIINAGTHKASSIKVAEASKVIENTQRDANIALINEFSLIFHRLGIDTTEVLEAAGTKWNFLPFRAGLVGGHCIGVDPYYLIQKAQSVGYYPDILLACRRINDAMGQHIASEVVKLMIKKGHAISGARVLVLGFTFKENCPDLRNTRVIDLVSELRAFGARVEVFDPWADLTEARREYGIELQSDLQDSEKYDAVVIAVGHEEFKTLGINALRGLLNNRGVIYDVKGILAKSDVDARL